VEFLDGVTPKAGEEVPVVLGFKEARRSKGAGELILEVPFETPLIGLGKGVVDEPFGLIGAAAVKFRSSRSSIATLSATVWLPVR
jgi:hypothetical protein